MRQAVIDASVVLKWYLKDEENSMKAMSLLERYVSDDLDIIAPSLLEYEVINGLIIAQKRGRVDDKKVITAVDGFMNLEIKLKSLSGLYSKVLRFCNVYKCSAYDAAYLTVADDEDIFIITADERLYNMVKKDMKRVKWIGDI